MSSYGAGDAWDGGPPGAEADYAPPYSAPAAPPAALPSTDPWTGASYSSYAPTYDYSTYNYGYNYDSSYYQNQDGSYYKYPNAAAVASTYPPPPPSYDYTRPQESYNTESRPIDPRAYERRRSYSRSVSPYIKRERSYSRKRESIYERGKRGRSRSKTKSKRSKYSSGRSSSRSSSRSYSRLASKDKKKRVSRSSSESDKSYRKVRAHDRSLTPPLKNKKVSRSRRSRSYRSPVERSLSKSPKVKIERESRSKSPKVKIERDSKEKDMKAHSSKDYNAIKKTNQKIKREVVTPPPKKHTEVSLTPPKAAYKKSDRFSITPPKSYKTREPSLTPPRNYKYKSGTRKHRDSSVTPPKSYAINRSSSRSKSRSRSSTPRQSKRKRSRTPKQSRTPKRSRTPRRSRTPKTRRTTSRSSSRSSASDHSRSKSKRRTKHKSVSKQRSRSRSRSNRRSVSKSPSTTRRPLKRSATPEEASKSRSRSKSSESDTPSDDARRGQFTVADRKRYWKLHRSKQDKIKSKTPPKEVKPPPGAEENTKVDDIEYGVPPEVEGVNFADLLPTPDQVLTAASMSKSKNVPLPIKNDGSFLEMFKKMQEETKKIEEVEKKPEIKKPLPFIGKRRGGRVLKTGIVKKAKAIDEQTIDNTPKDAWSLYMQEVKKYRETSCEEERKTRPLVK